MHATETHQQVFYRMGQQFSFVTCNPIISYVEISNRIPEVRKSLLVENLQAQLLLLSSRMGISATTKR